MCGSIVDMEREGKTDGEAVGGERMRRRDAHEQRQDPDSAQNEHLKRPA